MTVTKIQNQKEIARLLLRKSAYCHADSWQTFLYCIGITSFLKARKIKKIYVGVGGKARLVYQSYIPVTGISAKYTLQQTKASYTYATIYYNYAIDLTATVNPSNATNPAITWTVDLVSNGYNSLKDRLVVNIKPTNNGRNVHISAYTRETFSLVCSCNGVIKGRSVDGAIYQLNVVFNHGNYTDKDGDTDDYVDISVE